MIAWARGLAVPTLAALAWSGCTIEPPGPSTTSTSYSTAFELTAAQPVVVRTLEFRATPGATEVGNIEGFLTVTGKGGGGPGSTAHSDVWVSILNADTGVASDGTFGNGHASIDGWGHSIHCDGTPASQSELGSNPSPPCESRWTVIARWIDPEPGTTIPLELSASMLAHARAPAATAETFSLDVFSITERSEPSFAGAPMIVSGDAHGSARVTPGSDAAPTHFVLRIPADALAGDASYPRIGRLFLSTTVTDWSGSPDEARVAAVIADRTTAPYGGTAGELEWLSLCAMHSPCELWIDVTTSYWESAGSGRTSSPNGFMALDWTLEVRLEDFGAGAPALPRLELEALP